MTRLEPSQYLDLIRSESDRFRNVLTEADPTARVPSCPDWDAADLLWHLTGVQHFWSQIITHRPAGPDGLAEPVRPTAYADLLTAFDAESAGLVAALGAADARDDAWTWAAEQTVGFTYRRQAHEALIHRLDAELFREKASWAQQVMAVDVTVEGGSVRIDMHQPNTDIPSFAKAIAGQTTHAIQAETWTGGDTAEFSVTTPGKPAGIHGTRRLVADGAGTLDTFEGESKAKIPLVGGKIETLIGDKLKDGWDTEHGVGTTWLEGKR